MRPDRGTAMALTAMGLAVVVLANDFSAINVALPSIEHDFDSNVSTAQWVINAYALVFGMLIVTGGRLADMFGRRRVFFTGAGIFAAMSLAGGLAPNEGVLIATRALMGIGGAMMWPAILGMTYAALPESKAGLAGGLIIGAAGVGQAVGPIVGGVFTEFLSWRWIFFANIPIAAFAVAVTYLKVHQSAEVAGSERIDYAGIATLSAGVLALLFALDQGTDWGFTDPRIVGCFIAALLLVVAFTFVERRAGNSALVPAEVIKNRAFASACVAIALMAATFFAALLYLPQFMQKVLDYSPLEAGLGMLPVLAVFAAASFVAGPLYQKLGAKLMVTIGAGCIAIGPALLSLVKVDSGYSALIAGMVVLGLGLGFFYSSATTAGVTALDKARTSLAGGLVYMFQIVGGAIGLGLTTTVFTSLSEERLHDEIVRRGGSISEPEQNALQGILAGTDSARELVGQYSPQAIELITDIAKVSFTAGLQNGLRLDAALAAIGLLVAALFVGGRLHESTFRNDGISEKKIEQNRSQISVKGSNSET